MQAGEGTLTQVARPDYGKELKQEAQEALEELRNPGWLKSMQSGTWVSRAGGKPGKISLGLAASDFIICIFRLSLHRWISTLAAIRITWGAFKHLIPDPLYQNLCKRDPGITSSRSPQAFPLDSQG